MSALSRRKGATWEREVARILRAALPGTDPHRGHQSRCGSDAPDVVGTPFHVECKHRATLSPEAALRQAQEDRTDPTLWPLAVLKRNRSAPFVCMDLEDFAALVSQWWATRPKHGSDEP